MNRSSYYLKQNVVAEPLVHGWYAWAHLIPPTTLSRNITERHVKIMESYIESPETHEAAVEDPKFLGGPFKDLKQTQVERVAELRERTLRERRLAGSNCERALSIVEQFRCKEVYVCALGQEPCFNYVMSIKYMGESNPIIHSNRLMATRQARGIRADRLFGEKEILLD